ncbi:MAG: molybdenum ABC transporter ATP-binding protein [Woeseiaceae bacterium]|nr:molybdenum ABC transporter ATP-binding protein [Woeseiaceae bacterium]
MSEIQLKHTIQKGGFRLDVDTRIPATGITGVFGESGSGKTTLLRCIAGLEGSERSAVAVHRRRIGYVFQEPQLFPHLTVRKNIEFGMRRNPAATNSVDEVAKLLEVEGLLDRSTKDLSGGEAQRVSIARVLCQSPRLILMDEPLSALDERRRNEVLPFLDRLHAETSAPIIYVSHNIDEICRLSDHLLVLDDGKLVAEGGIRDTLTRIDLPQLGGRNAGAVIDVKHVRYDGEFDLTLFGFSGGEIWAPGCHDPSTARLRISASDISLSRSRADSSTILNILPAVIVATATESAATELLRLGLGDDILVARITRRSLQQLNLQLGDKIYAQIKSVTVRR